MFRFFLEYEVVRLGEGHQHVWCEGVVTGLFGETHSTLDVYPDLRTHSVLRNVVSPTSLPFLSFSVFLSSLCTFPSVLTYSTSGDHGGSSPWDVYPDGWYGIRRLWRGDRRSVRVRTRFGGYVVYERHFSRETSLEFPTVKMVDLRTLVLSWVSLSSISVSIVLPYHRSLYHL